MSKKRIAPATNKKGRIWNKTLGHCHLCGEKLRLDGKWQMDHVVPRARGGADEEWNLLPVCGFCNRLKSAAKTYRMRRILMYGRYCLDEAIRRDRSWRGQIIYDEVVGRRVRILRSRATNKPPHVYLWKHTPRGKT